LLRARWAGTVALRAMPISQNRDRGHPAYREGNLNGLVEKVPDDRGELSPSGSFALLRMTAFFDEQLVGEG
jgi:hypothetical protein